MTDKLADDSSTTSSSTDLDMDEVQKQREEFQQSLKRLQQLSEESRKSVEELRKALAPLRNVIELTQVQEAMNQARWRQKMQAAIDELSKIQPGGLSQLGQLSPDSTEFPDFEGLLNLETDDEEEGGGQDTEE